MRKSLKMVPVFGPDQDETKDQPIDRIARSLAGFLIADGRALSLKGRAIRLLPNQPRRPLVPRIGASSRPSGRVIHQYATAKRAGSDEELVAAIDEFANCLTRSQLLDRETQLRSASKRATNLRRAARLADKAIIVQRQRFAHESDCAACQRIGQGG